MEGTPEFSNVNYAPGQIIANTVELTAGDGGRVSVYTHADATLIADLTRVVSAGEAANSVQLLDKPVRLKDTRDFYGEPWPLDGYTADDGLVLKDMWELADDPEFGSAILNVTITEPEAAGFLSAEPTLEWDEPVTTSVLNFGAGQTIANRVVVSANYYGDVTFYTNVSAHLIVDVIGFTKAPTNLTPKIVDFSSMPNTHFFIAPPLVDVSPTAEARVSADDPDANGIVDWQVDGRPATESSYRLKSTFDVSFDTEADGTRVVKIPRDRGEARGWESSYLNVPVKHAETGAEAIVQVELTTPYSTGRADDAGSDAAAAAELAGGFVSSDTAAATSVDGQDAFMLGDPIEETYRYFPESDRVKGISLKEDLHIKVPQQFTDSVGQAEWRTWRQMIAGEPSVAVDGPLELSPGLVKMKLPTRAAVDDRDTAPATYQWRTFILRGTDAGGATHFFYVDYSIG